MRRKRLYDASTYHGDPSADDADAIRLIGWAHGDFESAIAGLRADTPEPRLALSGAERRWALDRLAAGTPFNHEIAPTSRFHRLGMAEDSPLFGIVAALGIVGAYGGEARIHCQTPGQAFRYHVDSYGVHIKRMKAGLTPPGARQDDLVRICIAMRPWALGHLYFVGTRQWKWRAGEIVMFDGRNIPHATANLGSAPRYTFQFTGFATDQTKALLAGAPVDIAF